MRTKYFITPFGVSGTITPAVPNATDPSGFVSYSQGWTFDYQRDLTTDTLAKSPTYTNFNAIFNDITTSLQALQQGGVAEFITTANNGGSAFSYGLGALVLWSSGGTPPFNLYLSLVNANTALPSVTANWLDLTTFHSFPYGPLNVANTWTAAQTHTQPIIMANGIGITGKDTGGTARSLINYGGDNKSHLFGGQNGLTIVNFALSGDILTLDNGGSLAITGSFSLPNQVPVRAKDNAGTIRDILLYGSDNFVYVKGGQSGFAVNNLAGTAKNLSGDDSGNYQFGGRVTLNNNIPLEGRDTGGTPRTLIYYGTDNFTRLGGGLNGFLLTNAANSAINISGDDSGNYQFTGRLRVNDTNTEGVGIVGIGTFGANFKLTGNGGTTPSKYIRAFNGTLSFVNSAYNAEAMVMTDSGDLTLAGVSKPQGGVLIGGVSNPIANTNNGLQTLGNGPTQIYHSSLSPLAVGIGSTTPALIGFFFGANPVATITTNGSSVAYNNNVVSDYRIKTTYGLVSNSGAVIDAVPVYDAEYHTGSTHSRAMFLAHEFGELVPDAVSGLKDAVTETGDVIPQYLDVSAAIPYLWAEAQSLRHRTAALEAANETLQTALTSVLARLAALEAK